MHFINRLNQQRTQQRPLPVVDTGHSPYDRPDPPKSWEPGWQCPPIDPNSPEHQERILAFNITHHWKKPEEKANDDLG